MPDEQPDMTMEEVDALSVYPQLRQLTVFADLRERDVQCLGRVTIARLPAGTPLILEGGRLDGFWGVLRGEIRGFKKEDDGSSSLLFRFIEGDTFGEVPLLTGRPPSLVSPEVASDATLIRITEAGFWDLMATCPVVRQAILKNMGLRLQSYQAFALHREKLISLGTLAAGLMHELNNPGTAARRAATQLRENLVRLQQVSLRFCESPLGVAQIDCMKDLQERAFRGEKKGVMSSIDLSDAEECLAEWLDESGVQDSWKMAPTLTAIGLTQKDLDCTRQAFQGETFSDALGWLTSLVSSMQLVGTVEESISRVSELVMAVKKYAYNENSNSARVVDIHDGLQSTLTILGHKFRGKDLKIDRQFATHLPVIESRGAGLAQVWTNLLDNAVDASPEQGTIHIRTWTEDGNVCVGIADEGSGIAEEHREQIFSPFFTTKPVGVGTGLGLDIAHRIVVGSYGGQISFTSVPGKTEFVVQIPVKK